MKRIFILLIILLTITGKTLAQCESPQTLIFSQNAFMGCIPFNFVSGIMLPANPNTTDTLKCVWNFGDGTTDSLITPCTINAPFATHSYTLAGSYSGTLTATIIQSTGTCTGSAVFSFSAVTSPQYTCSVVGINEYDDPRLFSVFPNPNNGSFNLQIYKDLKNPDAQLENCYGQTVYETKVTQGQNQIHTGALTKGLYYLIVTENNRCVMKRKVVIE